MNFNKIVSVVSVAIGMTCASVAFAEQDIRGSGATFPSIIYSTWAFGYAKEKGVPVKYASTGSGEGVRSMTAREVDFGASDSPLSEEELKKRDLLQFPTVAGGIVPVVNIPGIATNQLKLTGPVLAEIFSGNIKMWNDPRIVSLNVGVQLPGLKISRVVREDASGTTEGFTRYLAGVAPEWHSRVGHKVAWAGEVLTAKGSDAVAQTVKETSGAIGYVSFDRVAKVGLAAVAMRNKSGQFVSVSERTIQAAVRGSGLRTDLRASLMDVGSSDCWPLVDVTYILIDAKPKSAAYASRTLKFFYWAFLKGDDVVHGTGFVPLPAEVQARVVRQLSEVLPQDGLPLEYTGYNRSGLLAMR